MNPKVCPVCGYQANHKSSGTGHSYDVECERCGPYKISGTCVAILGNPLANTGLLNTELKKTAVGHWIRTHTIDGTPAVLTSDIAEDLVAKIPLPSIHDQRENLIRHIGHTAGGPGESILIECFRDQYIIGSRMPSAFRALIGQIENEGLATSKHSPLLGGNDFFDVALTYNGWLAYEDIHRGKTSGRTAFMAMPFNKSDLDSIWLPQLRLAVGETGFTLKRVDDEPRPGLIDVRMRLQIKQARFLIVELTYANLGAYWEAGYAEGLNKPVIYTLKEGGETAHFDVDHSLRIVWHPDKIQDALDRLKATIRNELPDALLELTK